MPRRCDTSKSTRSINSMHLFEKLKHIGVVKPNLFKVKKPLKFFRKDNKIFLIISSQKMSAPTVQPFGRQKGTYIRVSCFFYIDNIKQISKSVIDKKNGIGQLFHSFLAIPVYFSQRIFNNDLDN